MLNRKKIIGYPNNNDATREKELASFKDHGIDVLNYRINIAEYNKYFEKANYPNYVNYYKGGKDIGLIEKSLEHYLAAEFLELSKNDIFIDVATGGSPAADIYEEIYGCAVYKQDLHYPSGINDNMIGSDATSMPLPDNFATKIALHCSFEHFEGNADIKFIKEVNRLLNKRGKMCILPLYLFTTYAIQIDPAIMPINELKNEQDAIIFCRKNWKNRFARYYDVPHFIKRIKNNLQGFDLKIYFILNEKEVNISCYVKFILVLEKKNDNF
jgi:ubiquinone/menaquinone biosynthesis C-methylase UbiE